MERLQLNEAGQQIAKIRRLTASLVVATDRFAQSVCQESWSFISFHANDFCPDVSVALATTPRCKFFSIRSIYPPRSAAERISETHDKQDKANIIFMR